MAFTLDISAAPAGEFRRVLSEQAYNALRALRDDDLLAGVHRARKATRRARAALRLARSGITDEQYRSLKVGFQDVGRALSPIRDADVAHRLAQKIGYPPPLPPPPDLILRRTDDCRARLQRLLAQIELEPLSIKRAAFIKGFARGYRVARRRMVLARTEPTDINLHDWRKSVKIHRHHLQLLSPIWPAMFKTLIDETDRLQGDLGRHRDLGLLEDALGELRPEHRDAQATHMAAAFARGSQLFAAQDRLLGAWLRAQWEQHPAHQ